MKKKGIIISALIIFVVAITFTVIFLLQASSPEKQDQAVREALIWRQSQGVMACGQAITPAIHKATGAQYTFNDTCLPPGWEANHQTYR